MGCYIITAKPETPKAAEHFGAGEGEAPILCPPDAKSPFIGKDTDAGKDRGQEKKGATEHEMVGWHHQCNGHEFEQIPGDTEGQGSLACCSPGVASNQTQPTS